jgi:hypothetical protein
VAVRDTKDEVGPVLRFSASEWRTFVVGIKGAEFKLPSVSLAAPGRCRPARRGGAVVPAACLHRRHDASPGAWAGLGWEAQQ